MTLAEKVEKADDLEPCTNVDLKILTPRPWSLFSHSLSYLLWCISFISWILLSSSSFQWEGESVHTHHTAWSHSRSSLIRSSSRTPRRWYEPSSWRPVSSRWSPCQSLPWTEWWSPPACAWTSALCARWSQGNWCRSPPLVSASKWRRFKFCNLYPGKRLIVHISWSMYKTFLKM